MKYKFICYFVFSILNFYTPVLIPIFSETVKKISQISFLVSVYSIARILCEFPSGIVADFTGRKRTICAGLLGNIVALTVMISYKSFWSFLIAELLLGCSGAIISGTDTAFLYDELKYMNCEKEYFPIMRVVGIFQSFGLFAAFFVCSTLSGINKEFNLVGSIICYCIAFIIILTIQEHPYYIKERTRCFFSEQYLAFRVLSPNMIREIVLVSAVEGIYNSIYIFLFPVILTLLSIPDESFGIFSAVVTLFYGAGCWSSGKNLKNNSMLNWKIVFLTLPVVLLLSNVKTWIVAVMSVGLIRFLWGILRTVLYGSINEAVENSVIRATAISAYGLLVNVSSFIVTMFLGVQLEKYNYGKAVFHLICILILIGMSDYILRKFR